MERVHMLLNGRVQGVGFRVAALRRARDLGVCGWIRNTADGAVELVAEGSRQVLDPFVEWCRHGPRQAVVRSVNVERAEPVGEAAFRIVTDAD